MTGYLAGGRPPQPRGMQLLSSSGSSLRTVSSSSSFSSSQKPGGLSLPCFLSLSQQPDPVNFTTTNPSLSLLHPIVLVNYITWYISILAPLFPASTSHDSYIPWESSRIIILQEYKGDTFTLVTILKYWLRNYRVKSKLLSIDLKVIHGLAIVSVSSLISLFFLLSILHILQSCQMPAVPWSSHAFSFIHLLWERCSFFLECPLSGLSGKLLRLHNCPRTVSADQGYASHFVFSFGGLTTISVLFIFFANISCVLGSLHWNVSPGKPGSMSLSCSRA